MEHFTARWEDMPARFSPIHGRPNGKDWVSGHDFASTAVCEAIETRTKAYDGNQRVAVSMVLHDYAALMLAPALAHAFVNGTQLDASLANVSVKLGESKLAGAAFDTWPESPAPDAIDGLPLPEAVLKKTIDENIEIVINTIKANYRISSRTLWMNVAHLTAGSIRVPDWAGLCEPISPARASRLLDVDKRIQGGCRFFALDAQGRTWLYHHRRGCCLKYNIQDGKKCVPCSLNADEITTDGYQISLDNTLAGTRPL